MKSRRSIIRIAIVVITPLVCFGLLKAGVVGTQTRPGARAAVGEDALRTPLATTAAWGKGYPRDYHVGINVSTYSLVNTASGNLLTVIPITSWSGRGPAMDFNLYHNSEDKVWRTSYGAHIDIIDVHFVLVVMDDGMEIAFTKEQGIWVPEPGFHSTLDHQNPNSDWTWTLKDQTVYTFSSSARVLISIADAAGNTLTVNRDAGNGDRITSVVDASDRALNFSYDPTSGVLDDVEESFVLPDANPSVARQWTFTYDANSRLSSVTDPGSPAGVININEYDSRGRITRIADKNGDEFAYGFRTDGTLKSVVDPAPFSHAQVFSYSFATTTYRSRRGPQWEFRHTSGTKRLEVVTDPFSKVVLLAYDSDFNVTSYTDQLSKVWTYTYDGSGNMLTATDPLMHDVTYTYDSLNNLLTVTDADSNVTELRYEASMIDPTVPTSIILPPMAAEPEAERTITLDYYDSTVPDALGQLEKVTDANGVETLFTYAQDGQPDLEIEGDVSSPDGRWKVFTKTVFDQGSRLEQSARYGKITAGGGQAQWDGKDARRYIASHGSANYNNDNLNRLISIGCPVQVSSPGGSGCAYYGILSGSPSFTYDAMDRLLTANVSLVDDSTGESSIHEVTNAYDELGRLSTTWLDTTEPTWDQTQPDVPVERDFAYTPNWATGEYDRSGPDGLNTHVDTDLAGRATHVERTTSSGMITADITYYDNHQVNTVTHGNGTRVKYTYFDNTTLKQILHETTMSDLILQMDYTYNNRELITGISETDSVGTTTTSFTYDSRGRLLTESRAGSYPYNLSYTYDQGGNRLTKTDNSDNIQTVYHHDLEAPGTYQTKNNRLMYYQVYDANEDLVERVDYEYELGDLPWAGNVTKITRKIVGNDVFYGTCLTYTRNGELWIVTEQTWEEDEEFGLPFNEQTVSITEFRGSGRGRYLTRQRDPASPTQVLAGTTTWYDYDGDEIYGDYEVDVVGQEVTATQIGVTQSGLGQVDYNGSGMSYFHSDHIGSTRLLTDSPSPHTIEDSYIYTAFGEKVRADGTIGTRYRYAGAYGYQDDSAFHTPDSAFDGMHVGHRYYSPAIGRFLQRDPIGLRGGLNVYEYVRSHPTTAVDPDGLQDGIGNPTPINPKPYPRPPGGRIKINMRPPRVKTPKVPVRFAPVVVVQCAVAAGVGYGVGTGINHAPRLFGKPKLSEGIGSFFYGIAPGFFDWWVG